MKCTTCDLCISLYECYPLIKKFYMKDTLRSPYLYFNLENTYLHPISGL